ncbi:MAG: ImmA/IrrE family metallo-endopeptidase [Desulfovibrionaceae bacterium]
MGKLQFHFEWESPQGARGPELRATWARLRIAADGEVITRVEDLAARSVRDSIYGPLYPIAEWIATNWWSLLNEVDSPSREFTAGYHQRHNLSAASEGFALPYLSIKPDGSRASLQWRSRLLSTKRVHFLAEGGAVIGIHELEDCFRELLTAVTTRLRDEGVENTFLAEEWQAIGSADVEERNFCQAMGRLGLDPYSEEQGIAQTVIHLASGLPASVVDEFFTTADPFRLNSQGGQLEHFFNESNKLDLDIDVLRNLKTKMTLVSSPFQQAAPWNQGYALARELRSLLNGSSQPSISTVNDLGSQLGVEQGLWEQAISTTNGMGEFLNAAVGPTRNESPYFAIAPSRVESGRVFLLCRALCEYLTTSESAASIVTDTYSERQKRNRAFAAEFLAPAEQLQKSISRDFVTETEIMALAADFGTSDHVIRHQIENHHLAKVSGNAI